MMKQIATFALLMLSVRFISAQINLDKTYNYSASIVKLETLGYKYFIMDVPAAQCRIYNTDHSVFKTINCNVSAGFYLYDIKYISEKLFDPDAGIELLFTSYKYVATQTSYYYQYESKIMNEDGTQILNMPNSLYNYVNQVGTNIWKLFSYCYDYSVSPEKVWTNIYSLPGIPVTGTGFTNKFNDLQLTAFPNPTSESVKVAYSLPERINNATLMLFDSGGKLVNQYKVDGHTDHLELNVNQFSKGIYHYFIEFNGERSESKKIVIR